MGSLITKIAKIGTNFIPGVGPLISGGIGAISGALGGSGTQGGQKGTSYSNQNTNNTSTQTPIEDEYFSSFRKAITGKVGEELQNARKPVYGDTEKASVISDINDLASTSIASLRRNLGASGALDSGRASAGIGDVAQGRDKEVISFLSKIPLLNRQYGDTQTNSLLNLGAGFAGRAPVGSTSTGTTTGTQNGTFDQNQYGPGFLKGLLGNIGGAAGLDSALNGPLSQLFGRLFKNKNSSANDLGSYDYDNGIIRK